MKVKEVAAYLRLSIADEDKDMDAESNSIHGQRALIKRHLMLHPELSGLRYTEYIDDGISGTTTARPSFQRMLQAARNKKISCIIVKDLSRFSRDYIVLGDYVEQIFPMLGIRFISINDHYDSTANASSLMTMNMALMGLVYDYYSKDQSKKRSSTIEYRMEKGYFDAHAPYGYLTNPGTHSFDIDPEAGYTVRLIFLLASRGMPPLEIAATLNDLEIMTPAEYNASHPELKKGGKHWKTRQPLWNTSKVRNILTSRTYLGELKLTKQQASIADRKKKKPAPEPHYYYNEAHHAPLVSPQVFKAAQIIFEKNESTKKGKPIPPQVLQGKLCCGYCGRAVSYRTSGLTAHCADQALYHSSCPKVDFDLPGIETIIYSQIKAALEQCIREEQAQVEAVRIKRLGLTPCQKKMGLLQRQLGQLREEKRSAYEQFYANGVSEQEFLSHRSRLSEQMVIIQSELSELREQEQGILSAAVDDDIKNLAATAREMLLPDHLTRELVTAYIDRIDAFGPAECKIIWRYDEIFRGLLAKASATGHMENIDTEDNP